MALYMVVNRNTGVVLGLGRFADTSQAKNAFINGEDAFVYEVGKKMVTYDGDTASVSLPVAPVRNTIAKPVPLARPQPKSDRNIPDGSLVNADGNVIFLPSYEPIAYGQEYFQHYQQLEEEGLAGKLSVLRETFVDKFIGDESLVDIGCGACTFIKYRNEKYPRSTTGYDVNQWSYLELQKNLWYVDAKKVPMKYASMWDVLEHEGTPSVYLDNVQKGVFISIPMYKNFDGLSKDKHFRPGEHVWYFTEAGLVDFMRRHGFDLKAKDDFETKFGRQNIMSYFFER